MPNINEMLLILDGFQYATPLDLNMGYYHIRLSKNASNFCMIVLTWLKYHYKHLPMGVAISPDIFQQKMNDLFHVFEFICSYIYKKIIFKKGDWIDHVQKLELTLNELKGKGIKFNIENLLFGQTEIEYLGFWVTRDGVKSTN